MYIIIINLGLKSIRCIVFNQYGRQILSRSRAVHTTIEREKSEQNAIEWLHLMDEVLEDVTSNLDAPGNIKYVSVTTSSSCYVGLDADYAPLTPVYMVSDRRATIQACEIGSLKKTSNEFYSYSSGIAKYMWLKQNHSDLERRIHYWVSAGEFLMWHLTGEMIVDPLNAEKCGYRDGGYNDIYLNAVSLTKEKLSKVKPIGYTCPILNKWINRYKLDKSSSLVLTTYDAICAVIGANKEPMTACDVSGTVTSVRLLSYNYENVSAPLLSQKIGVDNLNVIGSSNNLGGGIIEWYKQTRFPANYDQAYSLLESEAGVVSPGAGGVLFLPYLMGERSPFDLPSAKGVFFGISRQTRQAELTRAVLESTAFVTNDLLQLIRRQGTSIQQVSVSGGLARMDVVNQIKADVTGMPVCVLENFESTSLGAYILVSTTIGIFKSIAESCKSVVHIRSIFHPDEKNHEFYIEYFKLFSNLRDQLRLPFDELDGLVKKYNLNFKSSLENL